MAEKREKYVFFIYTLFLIVNCAHGITTAVKTSDNKTTEIEYKDPEARNRNLTENRTGRISARVLPFDTNEPRQLPVSIEIKEGSTLWSEPGSPGVINFEVTNNKRNPLRLQFGVHDTESYIRSIEPASDSVNPGSTVLVKVLVESRRKSSSPDVISLRAEWNTLTGEYESVLKKVFLYSGLQMTDSTKPDIWYTYGGDCSGAQSPHNCAAKTWNIHINLQDTSSGLLKIKSEPVGLTLRREFISGTRDVVEGSYSANCCHTKVDISASDVLGNYRTLPIDIDKKWLTAGEISAIVLGVLLILVIISVIIYFTVKRCRRQHQLLTIYPRHRPTSPE